MDNRLRHWDHIGLAPKTHSMLQSDLALVEALLPVIVLSVIEPGFGAGRMRSRHLDWNDVENDREIAHT